LRDRDSADDLVRTVSNGRLSARQLNRRKPQEVAVYDRIIYSSTMRKANRRGEAAMPLDASEAQAAPAEQVEASPRARSSTHCRRSAPTGARHWSWSASRFSYAEAANILGVPAGTLMSRIARGREELRGLLDDTARRRSIRIVEKRPGAIFPNATSTWLSTANCRATSAHLTTPGSMPIPK
jgi:RNA polymerase sigma-70 factor (ECF subfamily)